MTDLKFTPDLLLGEDDLDRQHQALFEQARAVLSAAGDRAERRALEFLSGYICYHFAAEESVMRNAGLDVHKHALQHNRLRSEALALVKESEDSGALGAGTRARLRVLIEEWLGEHIRTWDARLAADLRAALGDSSLPTPDEIPLEELRLEDVKLVEATGEISRYEMAARRRLKR